MDSYQIHKIQACACAGNVGDVFSCRRIQRKPLDALRHLQTTLYVCMCYTIFIIRPYKWLLYKIYDLPWWNFHPVNYGLYLLNLVHSLGAFMWLVFTAFLANFGVLHRLRLTLQRVTQTRTDVNVHLKPCPFLRALLTSTIVAWTKWPTASKRNLQMHFRE